ncbi:MAG: hypothetical protein HUJ55_04035 [Ileibacterium sp.]|nr:hypothetical protein [Ileibacterium sp.]
MERIVITAGIAPLPEAFLKQAQVLTGRVDGCYFAQGKTSDEFYDSFVRILEEHKDAELVVLCDGMQSKANEEALMAMNKYGRHGAVMVGMNLGMVINAMLLKDEVDTADQLVESLSAQGKAAVGGMTV